MVTFQTCLYKHGHVSHELAMFSQDFFEEKQSYLTWPCFQTLPHPKSCERRNRGKNMPMCINTGVSRDLGIQKHGVIHDLVSIASSKHRCV